MLRAHAVLVLQEVGDGGDAAVAGELSAEVLEGAGAACGGDAVHPLDGVLGGGHGGIDVAQGEAGLGDACQVQGVAAGERGPVVGLAGMGGEGVLEVPKGPFRVTQAQSGGSEEFAGLAQVEPVDARDIVLDGVGVGV
ncbi:hypothetical protein [Streptomyces sp. 8P21H-1]|uniref:hypothetical protein n=1 Tax=Streptomyces sp. 8P21H-1 TaxID=2737048 RepID=UPI00156E9347|nr:hypothetical protein [Streptomyces sp. 8P21H-1]NSL42758.1 hypothetical protein [Streptomyces sp. 8P21H-1]